MSYQSILEYLKAVSKIYLRSEKDKKTQLINSAIELTGQHRKSIIRALNKNSSEKIEFQNARGAKTKYPKEVLTPHVRHLWISMERMAPIRMKAALKDWLPHYKGCDQRTKDLIQKMSSSTLGRFIKNIKKFDSKNLKGLCSTSPARHMKNKVPINTLDSNIKSLGFVQADTVAHCGDRLEGEFINSITLTDIHSTWTENRALHRKKGLDVKHMLVDIEKSLPFKLKAINTDSGSEFLNMPIYSMYREKKIAFTRSRPYKKNDNCYVEQKNFTHVRELFGYQRFEDKELVDLMNDIYKNCWNPLQNYFLPTMKIKEKVRIGSKIHKKYDDPQTPYERLLSSTEIEEAKKNELKVKKSEYNPFTLKTELEKKMSDFFNRVNEYNQKMKELNAA